MAPVKAAVVEAAAAPEAVGTAAAMVVATAAAVVAVLEAVAPEPVVVVALGQRALEALGAAPQVEARPPVRAQEVPAPAREVPQARARRVQVVALLLAVEQHRQEPVAEESPRERQEPPAGARAVAPPGPVASAAGRQLAPQPTPPCRAPASWPHRRPILMAIPRLWASAALVRAPEMAPGQQALPASMAANRDSPEQPASVLPAGRRSMSSGESISMRGCLRAPLIA